MKKQKTALQDVVVLTTMRNLTDQEYLVVCQTARDTLIEKPGRYNQTVPKLWPTQTVDRVFLKEDLDVANLLGLIRYLAGDKTRPTGEEKTYFDTDLQGEVRARKYSTDSELFYWVLTLTTPWLPGWPREIDAFECGNSVTPLLAKVTFY